MRAFGELASKDHVGCFVENILYILMFRMKTMGYLAKSVILTIGMLMLLSTLCFFIHFQHYVNLGVVSVNAVMYVPPV